MPRVRDTEASTERPLQSYPAIKRARVPEELTDALLLAPRKGNYEHVARQQMIICMGVTVEGYKRLLGFTEATTEHSAPTGELFRGLLEPGLRFAGGVLCVMDGRKGLRKTIRDVLGWNALVQRCQRLRTGECCGVSAEGQPETWRRRSRLRKLGTKLNDRVGRRFANTKRMHHSAQRNHWMAIALLEAEGRTHRLAGFRHLPALQEALQEHVREPTSKQQE